MPITYMAPADDVASKTLVSLQTAITKVKSIVAECIYNNMPPDDTTIVLNKAIATECNKVKDIPLREEIRKSLVIAARKWHYQLTESIKIAIRKLQHQGTKQPLDIDIYALSKLTPMVRDIEFRKILDDGKSIAVPIIENYQKAVKIAMKAISADCPKVVSNGVKIPIRNRAEMAVRYDANVKSVEALKKQGVDLVWISSHPNCSPRCKDFQGKLYSLSGKKGTINGIPYDDINIAFKGKNADGNGCITGYNCRHRLLEYKKGSHAPTDFTEATINREYAIDRKQRGFESTIRYLKTEERMMRMTGDTKEASLLRLKWQQKTAEYKAYSLSQGRAFFPYRYIIDSTEVVDEKELNFEY